MARYLADSEVMAGPVPVRRIALGCHASQDGVQLDPGAHEMVVNIRAGGAGLQDAEVTERAAANRRRPERPRRDGHRLIAEAGVAAVLAEGGPGRVVV